MKAFFGRLIGKRFFSFLVGLGVTYLNHKYDLKIDDMYTTILTGAYIGGQTVTDTKKKG